MSRSLSLLAIALVLLTRPFAASAQSVTEASNWCVQAEANLTNRDGGPLKCTEANKRCVRMNNYWCQKHGSSPWKGSPDASGKDGHRDVDGHAIFASADWSARAIAADIRAKYRRGLTSAVAIASQYSPWCDTLGSKAVVMGSGRSCKDGRASPPSTFAGPICEAPKSSNPTTADCKPGCNCPPSIAATLVRNLGVETNADLQLFDKNGVPQPNLTQFLRNLALQEQGIHVRENVIAAGIAKLAQ